MVFIWAGQASFSFFMFRGRKGEVQSSIYPKDL